MWCRLTSRPEKEANLCTSLRCVALIFLFFLAVTRLGFFQCCQERRRWLWGNPPKSFFQMKSRGDGIEPQSEPQQLRKYISKRIWSPPPAVSSQDLSPRRICCWCHLGSPDAICGKSLNILKTLKSTQGKVGWHLRPPLEEIVKSGDDNATPLGGIFTDRWQSWTRLRQ